MKKHLVGVCALLLSSHAGAAPTAVAAGSRWALMLDGKPAGHLASFTATAARADAIALANGGNAIPQKEAIAQKLEEETMTIGGGLDSELASWIRNSLAGNYSRKNGSISTGDGSGKEIQKRAFTNALITEIGFPKLDGSSKDAAYITVKLMPESVKLESTGGGGDVGKPPPPRPWTASHFKVTIDGLDMAQVTHVDAFMIQQSVLEQQLGQTRNPMLVAKITWPTLTVHAPIGHLGALVAWSKSPTPKAGEIEYQDDAGKPFLRVAFHGLKPTTVTPLGSIVKLEMRMEKLTLVP